MVKFLKKLNYILLVEDNEFINVYNRKIIEKLDVCERIEVIEDATEALDYLHKQTLMPDLILLDINMPRMNGWEFIEEFLKMDREHKTKIVILSTSPNPDDVIRYSGFTEILCFEKKPLTKEKIHSIVAKYFGK